MATSIKKKKRTSQTVCTKQFNYSATQKRFETIGDRWAKKLIKAPNPQNLCGGKRPWFNI